jgi:flagellar biosynthetic protein FliO
VTELVAVTIVLALVAGAAYALRSGAFGRRSGSGAIVVETAVTLGERRSLVIVTVEGRRLLLGLTPSSMSLVTELDIQPSQVEESLA